jgi:hypothetical protein
MGTIARHEARLAMAAHTCPMASHTPARTNHRTGTQAEGELRRRG